MTTPNQAVSTGACRSGFAGERQTASIPTRVLLAIVVLIAGTAAAQLVERKGFVTPATPGPQWEAVAGPQPNHGVAFNYRDVRFRDYAASHKVAPAAQVRVSLVELTSEDVDTADHIWTAADRLMAKASPPGATLRHYGSGKVLVNGVQCVHAEAILTRVLAGVEVTIISRHRLCLHPLVPNALLHTSLTLHQIEDWDDLDAAGTVEADAFLDAVEFAPLARP